MKTLIKLPWVYNTKEAITKCKKGIKNIKQKNIAQKKKKKLGFRDTLTESSNFCQYLYIVRKGGKKVEVIVTFNKREGNTETYNRDFQGFPNENAWIWAL